MKYYYQTGVMVPFARKYYKQLVLVVAAVFLSSMALMSLRANAATMEINEPTVAFSAGAPEVDIVEQSGSGALYLKTPTGSDKAQVFVTSGGTLGDLESLSYRTYRTAGSGEQVASLNITVTPWAGTFVYEPVYDSSATVVNDTWQEWDAFSPTARWWRSGFPDTFLTWEQIIAGFEDRTVSAVMVNQGSGNGGLESYVDYVEVNDNTFDFEVAVADTEAPTAPVALGATSPVVACGGTTDSFNVTLGWTESTDNIEVAGYEYNVVTPNGTDWTTTVAGNSYAGAFNDGEGAYTYRVRAVDEAGNFSEWSNLCAVSYDDPSTLESKEECKNGGWALSSLGFKNQGDCVSFFATGGRNLPAGETTAAARGRR